MTSESWEPAIAAGFITLSWDCEGAVLATGAVAAAELTLHVDPAVEGIEAFTVVIVITAVEA